jgi:hypothetical protein
MTVRLERGVVVRRLGAGATMPPSALSVPQLRYWLAFGNRAGLVLAEQGHSYLHSLVPWIVLLIALSSGAFLLTLGRALGGQVSLPRYTFSFCSLWLLCAACLVAVYMTQELLEGLFATGHPPGMTGVFGYGGWWSIPAALAVGLVLAAAFHGARRVLQAVAERRACRRTVPARPPVISHPRLQILPLARASLADGWSGRGPPRG